MSQSSASPGKDRTKGVQWFKHFPTNFVRPYGPTLVSPSDETIWNRLQTFNCELLQRPKVGISELAASIEPNLKSLLDGDYDLIDHSHLRQALQHTNEISNSLNPLEKGSGIEVGPQHITNMLKQFLTDDQELLNTINEAFIVGSTLYTMAIQLLTARAVFRDPQQYARMLPMTTPGAKEFKENPSVKGMKHFLIENVVTTSTTSSSTSKFTSSAMLAQLESSDEEVTKRQCPSPPQISSEEDHTPKHKKGKKRVLEFDDDPEIQPAEPIAKKKKKSSKNKQKKTL